MPSYPQVSACSAFWILLCPHCERLFLSLRSLRVDSSDTVSCFMAFPSLVHSCMSSNLSVLPNIQENVRVTLFYFIKTISPVIHLVQS